MPPQIDAAEWFQELAKTTGAFAVQDTARCEEDQVDCVLTVLPRSARKPIQLFIEAKERITPQLALGFLHRMATHRPRGGPVLCARAISSRVAELCRSHNVGYLDASGNCRIAVPGLFIHVEGKRNLYPDVRPSADAFAPKSSRIVRLLLSDPKRGWQVQELAREAEISLGLASRIKHKLVEQAHVTVRDGRLYVREPRELLAAWTKAYQPPTEQFALYVMDDRAVIERKVSEWCAGKNIPHALTGYSGAWRLAPMVRYNVVSLYIDFKSKIEQLTSLREELPAKRVDDGANLSIWLPSDGFVFYGARSVDGVPVVSPIQLYLDLMAKPGRSAEAASEILDREILPKW